MDIEEMKRDLQAAVASIYSEDIGEFLRGWTALELLITALRLEGATQEEISQLMVDARRRALDKGAESG